MLSPSHLLTEGGPDWLPVDLKSCEALRVALDRYGGGHIPIDYPLLISYTQFRDPSVRKNLREALRDLPVDRIWLRIAGFGVDATGVGMSRVVEGSRDFHELGIPIIADQVGGVAAIAISAMGGVSGFASGIEGKQRFDASTWLRPAASGGGSGAKRIFIAGLDRFLSTGEMRTFFDDTRTSRHLFGCSDPSCCGDVDKMLRNPAAHLAVQSGRLVSSLSETPEAIRAEQFLENHLREHVKTAARASRIRNMDYELRRKVASSVKRLELAFEALSGLHDGLGTVELPAEAKFRSGSRQTELNLEEKNHEFRRTQNS
ncbi:hypothetical protein GCM10023325_03770 [Sphingomonas lutea]